MKVGGAVSSREGNGKGREMKLGWDEFEER